MIDRPSWGRSGGLPGGHAILGTLRGGLCNGQATLGTFGGMSGGWAIIQLGET